MLAAIEQHRPALTYIAYPNNPTANLFDDARHRPHRRGRGRAGRPGGLRRGLPALCVAHLDASAWRAPARAGDAHAVQVRPGRRAPGLPVRRAALIDEIDKVRPPYNVSVLNAEATLFALEHADVYARQAALLRASASGCGGAARAARRAALPQRGQHDAGARARLAARLRRHEVARGVLVKHIAGLHPLLANCLRLTVGTPDENDAMIAALKRAYDGTAPRRRPPRHQRNQIRVRSTWTAAAGQLATGIGFFDHMLDQIARHGLIDLEVEARATCTSTATTRWRTWASRWARRWPGGGRQEGHHPLRPRLRAAGRGAVARGGRLLRPPGPAHGRALQGRHDRRLRHPAGLRVLPGLRQPRAGHAAHRQPEGRQRAPPVRDGVQGLRPRAAHGADARPARGRRDPVHQGSL
jgi:hypothetical protein